MIIIAGLIILGGIIVEGIDRNCDAGTNFYRDIGCKPSCDKQNGCPLYYKCDEYKLKNDTCLFRGKYYSAGEKITETERCNYCECAKDEENSSAYIICAVADCADLTPKPNEYLTYENMDSCCLLDISKKITASTPKCVSDGKTYYEGQRFYPANSCFECLCQKGYTGEYKAPHCRRVRCDVELYSSDAIVNKCAPIYGSINKCCPSSYLCPADITKPLIIKGELQASVKKENNQCSFASRRMAIGGSFVVQQSGTNVTCNCDIPPMVSCTE